MAVLEGVVERLTFHNEESGYTVARFTPDGQKDSVTIVGVIPEVHAGERLKISGDWTVHTEYGRQFTVNEHQRLAPATLLGIEKYLGSGLIKGIGPAMAKRIVTAFGLTSLEVIEKTPDRLLDVEGIGEKKAKSIVLAVAEHKAVQDVMVFLQGTGITPALAAKIYRQYGDSAIETVRANPYRMADEIFGIGFKTADRLAQQLGIDPASPERLRSGIRFFMGKENEEGHIYALRQFFLDKVAVELNVESSAVNEVLQTLIDVEEIQTEPGNDGERIYMAAIYRSEFGVAERLTMLIRCVEKLNLPNEADLFAVSGVALAPEQQEAVQSAIHHGVLVVTGGPGTGKTTTVKGIIQVFRRLNRSILLAAPTGRAAKRMGEATGETAKTIHRLLEYGAGEGKGKGFGRNEETPLDADVVIVDETSMVDLLLFYQLLKAVPRGARLILVGDGDQLPSVGAGNVLRDLVQSGVVPVVRLKTIFRQAMESHIVVNAHRINQGSMPEVKDAKDFYFIKAEDPEKIISEIIGLVANRLPRFLHCDAMDDIQVLSPMRRTVTGVENLNQLLQERLNPHRPNRPEVRVGGVTFRSGDKVMQIRNNYSKMIFNGDIGRVVKVDTEERQLHVVFPEPGGNRVVVYDSEELDELVLSYAVSVHKSQGSEYPVVVMPITTQHFMMLQRNLIYTGITRAKRLVVLVGTWKALAIAVQNNKIEERRTSLDERLASLMRDVEKHQGA